MDIYEQFVEDINDLEDQRKKYINLIVEDTSKPAEYYLTMIEAVDLQLNIRLLDLQVYNNFKEKMELIKEGFLEKEDLRKMYKYEYFYKNFNDWEWDPCLSGMCDQCTKIPDQTRGLAQLINNDKLITLCNKCAEDLGVKTI